MLETLGIGPSLREARIRRGIGLDRVEAATRIRTRYLEASRTTAGTSCPPRRTRRGSCARTRPISASTHSSTCRPSARTDARSKSGSRRSPSARTSRVGRAPRCSSGWRSASPACSPWPRGRLDSDRPRRPHRETGVGAADAARRRAGDACAGSCAATCCSPRATTPGSPSGSAAKGARLGRDAAAGPDAQARGSRSHSGSGGQADRARGRRREARGRRAGHDDLCRDREGPARRLDEHVHERKQKETLITPFTVKKAGSVGARSSGGSGCARARQRGDDGDAEPVEGAHGPEPAATGGDRGDVEDAGAEERAATPEPRRPRRRPSRRSTSRSSSE